MAVLHELGHTLGLGHPDQEQSIHSTTTSSDWSAAVMHSGGYHTPDSPQRDDIQAIQYYYGNQISTPPPPPPPTSCVNSPTALCLNGRFRAEVSRGRGRGTNAAAVPLSADTGYFWFFSSSNVEVVVKVVDGRSLNRSYWIFFGGLSDVEYTLTVTDTSTGDVKTYTNQQGTLASVADTSAFPETRGRTGAAIIERRSRNSPSSSASLAAALGTASSTTPSAGCTTGNTNLCLNSSRFRVQVAWRTLAGGSGTASAVPLTTDTGYFWFFSASNVEVVLKVVDGRSFNGRFWVFYGSLSDVEYTVTVTDTVTGVSRSYSNPQGRLASIADTAAF
jgi:hypothetical protein